MEVRHGNAVWLDCVCPRRAGSHRKRGVIGRWKTMAPLAGRVLYAAWAIFGYVVDIARPAGWRSPILWPVFIPYVLLYFLSSLMFYWWPLGNIQRPLWFVYAVLFGISTILNISSHR
jgi:hypothetical protein